MTLTVTQNASTATWVADLSETDLMAALYAGLQALYPGQVPTVDFEEAGDGMTLQNNGTLCCVRGGGNTMTISLTDAEPAA